MEAPESHTRYYNWEGFHSLILEVVSARHLSKDVFLAVDLRVLPCHEKMQLFQMEIYCLLLRTDNKEDYS